MIDFLDRFLNRITMYRLVLYYLIALVAVAMVFGAFGILPYGPLELLFSVVVLTAICWVTNKLFADAFKAQANVESAYITALILALIITPVSPASFSGVAFLVWAAVFSMASKYILAIKRKHLFNPAAIAVALTAFTIGQSASWWVGGNLPMMAFVIAGGLLVTRKIQRFDLVIAFFAAAMVSIVLTSGAGDPVGILEKAFLHAPLFFFAFVMLTEPLTTPGTRNLRIAYGAFVGFLFAPLIHIGPIYSTPELALVVGNVFSYCVSPFQGRPSLVFAEKREMGTGTYDFTFTPDGTKTKFKPGQYMEFTLGSAPPVRAPISREISGRTGSDATKECPRPFEEHPIPWSRKWPRERGTHWWDRPFGHDATDSRGNRRYFTIASSPTEHELHLGVKFHEDGSSFKKKMLAMEAGDRMMGGALAGDFTLPEDKNKKLAFVAGGIGVTPFRSMAKWLTDTGDARSVVMLYSNRNASDVAYREIFDEAREKIGMRTLYVLTGADQVPPVGDGIKGRIDAALIRREIPDHAERIFYVSGTHAMVVATRKIFRELGIPSRQIKTDFFPGF